MKTLLVGEYTRFTPPQYVSNVKKAGEIRIQGDCCECNFPSDPARVRNVVRTVLDFIVQKQDSLTQEEQGDLRLILSELLYNAIIHGNRKDPRKQVHLRVEAKSRQILASITDEGSGFDHRAVLARVKCMDSLMEESGRGMILVCALTDKLTFNERGNRIEFVKKLGVQYG